jgi:hypothetical protein
MNNVDRAVFYPRSPLKHAKRIGGTSRNDSRCYYAPDSLLFWQRRHSGGRLIWWWSCVSGIVRAAIGGGRCGPLRTTILVAVPALKKLARLIGSFLLCEGGRSGRSGRSSACWRVLCTFPLCGGLWGGTLRSLKFTTKIQLHQMFRLIFFQQTDVPGNKNMGIINISYKPNWLTWKNPNCRSD